MSWITWAIILVLLPIAAVAFSAWYALAVPGTAHEGPLPAVTTEERDLAARLRTHVTAIASVPHNIKHYAALERSAQYIERVLQEQGYPINRQIFDVARFRFSASRGSEMMRSEPAPIGRYPIVAVQLRFLRSIAPVEILVGAE